MTQPRYRLLPYHPLMSPYAQRLLERRGYCGYVLEVCASGVLVSPLAVAPCAINGALMLFETCADAEQFVDVLASNVPQPTPRSLPIPSEHHIEHPPFRLYEPDPVRGHRGTLTPYRGYVLFVSSRGCTISYSEHGPYKIRGCYVVLYTCRPLALTSIGGISRCCCRKGFEPSL